MTRNRIAAAIAMFLMLTMSTSMIGVPVVQAVDIPTYMLLNVSPSPVGIGQVAYVNAFMSKPTPTANFVYGDLYEGITVEVTRPDGTKQTLGPYTADTTGGTWDEFVPAMAGNYTFQAFYPGQTVKGKNSIHPEQNGSNPQTWGSKMLPSTSVKVTLVVQEQSIPGFDLGSPLPTEYWSRPVISTNFQWAQLCGNWLGLRASGFAISGMYDATGNFQPYTTAPNTAHILWRKPTAFGGLVGAPINADQESQYMSTSIATMCFEPIIINGVLFYTHYPEMTAHRASWIAVDIRTGKELWNKPCGIAGNETLRYGQVVQFHSIQEYGANAYLWSVAGTSEGIFGPAGDLKLRLYDPMTCTYVCEIVNGTQNLAMISDNKALEQGTLLGWYTSGGNLILWNSTRALAYPTTTSERPQRTFRPSGSINWSAGIEWQKPIPTKVGSVSITGSLSIAARTPEVILLRTAPNYATQATMGYQITAGMDARTGELLWGPINQTIPSLQDVSLLTARDGVYILHNKDTNEAYGYSLENGNMLWGPVKLQGNAFSSIARGAEIAYGRVYIWDFGGYVNALDIKTGKIDWTVTPRATDYDSALGWPIWSYSQCVCDGKLFLSEGSLYNPPLSPGTKRLVINCTTGELVWSILSYSCRIPSAHADGMMVQWNSYDKQIDAFGKGQTSATIAASPKVSVSGNNVLVEGTVLDESPGTKDSDRIARFPHGVPAVSDKSMSAWMEYVYMQQPKPADVVGVEVVVEVLDPNNNYYEVGRATSDSNGFYSLEFMPDVPGKYTLYTRFVGSESYWPSSAVTAISVQEAISVTTPEPTQAPASMADLYFMPVSIFLIIAIVAVLVLMLLMFRKR